MNNLRIVEYKNGKFQVISDNYVLRPRPLTWEKLESKEFDFMYFDSFDCAKSALDRAIAKITVVNIHKIDTTDYEGLERKLATWIENNR